MSGKEKTNGSLAMAPRVITIPAANQETARKLRVAAYARVSSNSEDQKHSFTAQNAYFSKLITDNPDWELADIYADQGITGTSIDKRDDFLRMMEDCRKGRIDRILVKSSSRFARNTKESLEAVRELAALGVSVYFEEQNIDTAQVSGEVLIAMFAALAQRESEAISERMRWSYQFRIRQGRFSTCKAPYGYRLIKDHLEVREDEATVIRYIFERYLAGISADDIAKEITAKKAPDAAACWPCARRFPMGDILRISNPVSAGIGAILLPPRQSLARSPLWRPIQRLNCVACRYLFRCLSASCFRRIRTAQSGQYFARLDFGVDAAPHTAHRFTLSRLWMISAYSAPSSGRTAARNHRHSNE